VDTEMKRLLDEAYDTAMRVLEQHRELLERIAEALLERETVDREEIGLLAAGEPLPEAKIIKKAREFADTLRREKGALTAGGSSLQTGGEVAVATEDADEPEPGR
jgi:hypothetical protein